ncbi:hypothetical protein IFVP195_C130089 [Vibrio parahaemolyticus]
MPIKKIIVMYVVLIKMVFVHRVLFALHVSSQSAMHEKSFYVHAYFLLKHAISMHIYHSFKESN